ncbi:hypothetical protein BVX97_03820 [bacterium E08(2017)]|nr:hypothetical protein BVX97_03820 [bacterium E08(2017)]
MLAVIKDQAGQEDESIADGWIELLLDELVGRGDVKASMKVLAARSVAGNDPKQTRSACKAHAQKIFNDRVGKILVESCGFDEKIPTSECVRRLDLLRKLKPGQLCYEKTWGYGEVTRVDDFYKKVTIDFSKNDGHQMSFSYAAESLMLLGDDHLFAIHYKEPDKLSGMIADEPGEVAKIALRSVGEMSPVDLQDCLVEHGILKEDEWKGFWEKARKALKKDPLVDIPAKRSDKIMLLDEEKAYDDKWFEMLKAETDVDKILELLEELKSEGDIKNLGGTGTDAVLDRIKFAFVADDTSNPGRLARTTVIAESYHLDEGKLGIDKIIDSFFTGSSFTQASSELPTRFLQKFIDLLSRHDTERFRELLLDNLPEMQLAVLNSVMDYLMANDYREHILDSLEASFNSRKVAPVLLLWLSKRDDVLTSDGVLSYYNLLVQMLVAYEGAYTGVQLKMRNQLGALFEQDNWIKKMLEQLSPSQREDILRRIKSQACWDVSAKRSVMGKMIKMYPELEKVMASGGSDKEERVGQGRYTSLRSYREKQEILKKIVEVDIPQNSKDIGIARSYGDLRENAEYETAKQNQSILMKRKDELEQELVTVQSTDFSNLPKDKVGMGTCVVLESESGERKQYNVLGEWDSDENLSIISSRSKLAEILMGRTEGDEAELPSSSGSEKHRIIQVTDVSDEIKSWVKATK